MVRLVVVVGLALLIPPIAHADDATSPPGRRERGDLAIRARAILRKYCGECHDGAGGPSTLSVVDYKQLTAKGQGPVPFVSLGGSPRSQVTEFVEDGSMPPGGRPRPTPEEVGVLKRWVADRAPSYPRAFDERTTLEEMLADWDAQKEEARPHLRYLSFAHLIGDDKLPDLRAGVQRLQTALAAASGKPVTLEPVDDAATLFRLDLRSAGWDTPDLFDRIEKRQPRPDAFPMVAFDLLGLEYPHAVALPADGPFSARLRSFLSATRPLRPIPYFRADWVGEALAPNAPLAADLKSMVDLADVTAKGAGVPCGPPVRPFAGMKPVKAAASGGRPPVPPLSSWYSGDVTAVPEPFGVTAEVVREADKTVTKAVAIGEKFRLRVSADREVRFVLLNVLSTGDVRILTVPGGNILRRGEPREIGSQGGEPFAIGSSLTGADTATEHFVLVAAEGEPPAVRVARSRHSLGLDCEKEGRGPVWRFLLDPPTKGEFDAARAVRKVVPLTVTRKKP
jgi:hypothetical protein